MTAIMPMASSPDMQVTITKSVNFMAFPMPTPAIGKSRQ